MMITLYPYALFFHIVGVLGLGISVSLEAATVFRLRGAKTTAQVHEWMGINATLEKILPISALLILVSGLFMASTVWGWSQAWIDLALGTLIAVGVLGAVINGPRMKAIHRSLEGSPDGPVPDMLKQLIADPVLWAYAQIPGFLSLGAVALMTLKLDWTGSIVVLVLALLAGLISGQLSRKTSQPVE